jgi:membrane-bound lytic murein transglycosylase A
MKNDNRKSSLRSRLVFGICVLGFLFGCVRAPLDSRVNLVKAVSSPELVTDDLGFENLKSALKQNIEYLSKNPSRLLELGPVQIMASKLLESQEELADFLSKNPSPLEFKKYLDAKFQWYAVYGNKDFADVFVTSYYAPKINASKVKTKSFDTPIYEAPKDLITVDIKEFVAAVPDFRSLMTVVRDEKSRDAILRGRLEDGKNKVVPYYSREEMVTLKKSNLARVIAWADAIDVFVLQIQGSGILQFSDGSSLTVGYAEQNGHKYYPIGKELLAVIPKEKMSMALIKEHLRSLPVADRNVIMNKNPSYVFFTPLDKMPLGSWGWPVIDGRSIATDTKYFPKGLLGFLEFQKPKVELAGELAFQTERRFVFDHDTGGAIRGPGRLDLYWGSGGAEVEMLSGAVRHDGKLWYLLPK